MNNEMAKLVKSAMWNYRPCDGATSIEIGRLETICPISQTAHFHTEIQVVTVTHGWRGYSTPPPVAYRLAHRLLNARSLLKKGGTVADVAYSTSFADQSHLGRLFRRAYGATPGAYRSAFTTT